MTNLQLLKRDSKIANIAIWQVPVYFDTSIMKRYTMGELITSIKDEIQYHKTSEGKKPSRVIIFHYISMGSDEFNLKTNETILCI